MRHFLKLAIAASLAFILAACAGEEAPAPAPAKEPAVQAAEPEAPAAEPAVREAPPPSPSKGDEFDWPQTDLRAKITTSMGEIVVELYQEAAPATVQEQC